MIDWMKGKHHKNWRNGKGGKGKFLFSLYTPGNHEWFLEVWFYAGRRTGYVNEKAGPFISLKLAKFYAEEYLKNLQ